MPEPSLKKPDKTHLGPFAYGVERHKLSSHLHGGHILALKITYAPDGGAVYVMSREMIEHVVIGPYAEILLKKLGTLGGPIPANILYRYSSRDCSEIQHYSFDVARIGDLDVGRVTLHERERAETGGLDH